MYMMKPALLSISLGLSGVLVAPACQKPESVVERLSEGGSPKDGSQKPMAGVQPSAAAADSKGKGETVAELRAMLGGIQKRIAQEPGLRAEYDAQVEDLGKKLSNTEQMIQGLATNESGKDEAFDQSVAEIKESLRKIEAQIGA